MDEKSGLGPDRDPIADVSGDPTLDELYPKVLAKDPKDVTADDLDVIVAKQRADHALWDVKKEKEAAKKEAKAEPEE